MEPQQPPRSKENGEGTASIMSELSGILEATLLPTSRSVVGLSAPVTALGYTWGTIEVVDNYEDYADGSSSVTNVALLPCYMN